MIKFNILFNSKRKDGELIISIVKITFSDALTEYLSYKEKRTKRQGFVTVRRNFKLHIAPYFKKFYISDIKKKDIINWQNKILDCNFSNSFNNSLYYEFSDFINFCVDCDYIEENIILKVGNFKKKYEKKEHKTYNLHQFLKFRKNLDLYVDKCYFTFMFFYGTRPSETLGLRFCDIKKNLANINHTVLRRENRALDTPKNQSSIRTITIGRLMQHMIKKLKKIYTKKYGYFNDEFFVFGGKKPLSTTTLDRHKEKASKKAKLYTITQHEFRHSYATRLLNKGVPVDYISKSMGHSTVSMTLDIYCHNEKRRHKTFFSRFFY